jgi:hypothetical protein
LFLIIIVEIYNFSVILEEVPILWEPITISLFSK